MFVFSNLGWKTVDSVAVCLHGWKTDVDSRDASMPIAVSVSGPIPSSYPRYQRPIPDILLFFMTMVIIPFEGYWTLKWTLKFVIST